MWALVLYAFTMAGRIVSGDGEAMFQTTIALVRRGGLAIDARPETAPGRDGRAYSKYGLGQSVVQAPFVVAGLAYGSIIGNPPEGERAARFLVGLVNGVVTVATVTVLWVVARDAGAGRGASTAIAVLSATTTLFAPYARADFAEPTQALALLIAAGASLRARHLALTGGINASYLRSSPVRWATVAGVGTAIAFLTKAASLILAPAVLLPLVVVAWGYARPSLRNGAGIAALRQASPIAIAAGVPVVAAGALQAMLNWYRFGDPLEFGYGDEPATGFITPVTDGVDALLFASGKGLAWFAPTAMVGIAGLFCLARTRPLIAATAFMVTAIELVYYARWWAWHGDWSWGPRYLYVVVPFLMLGWLAPALAWQHMGAIARLTMIVVSTPIALAGLWVNILGVAIDYGAYYSVVGNQLGRGIDVRHARVVPEFSPLFGHAWLLEASLAESVGGYPATTNPYRDRYPWAETHPELIPEAPERAYGFDIWWAAGRGRDRFLDYWASVSAVWLALMFARLSASLWKHARVTSDGTTRVQSLDSS
jgi:hypothetical protein